MLNWLKGLLGIAPVETKQEPLVLENPIVEEPKATAKPKVKKTATKKAAPKKIEAAIDFTSMNKTQLLAEAKARGVKANASLKREEILERLKNAN